MSMKPQNLQRYFGFKLREHADKSIRLSFGKIVRKEIDSDVFKALLKAQLGITHVGIADRKYFYTNKSFWDEVVKEDWIRKIWTKEGWDCDNMAFYFSAEISRLFGLTSQPATYGDFDKGTFHDRHYWNTILCEDKGALKLYTWEPKNETMVRAGELVNGAMYSPIKIHLAF